MVLSYSRGFEYTAQTYTAAAAAVGGGWPAALLL